MSRLLAHLAGRPRARLGEMVPEVVGADEEGHVVHVAWTAGTDADAIERLAWRTAARATRKSGPVRMVESGVARWSDRPKWATSFALDDTAWSAWQAGKITPRALLALATTSTPGAKIQKGTRNMKKAKVLRKAGVAAAQAGAVNPTTAVAALRTAVDKLAKAATAADAAGDTAVAQSLRKERILLKLSVSGRAAPDPALPPGMSRLFKSTRTTAVELADDDAIGYR